MAVAGWASRSPNPLLPRLLPELNAGHAPRSAGMAGISTVEVPVRRSVSRAYGLPNRPVACGVKPQRQLVLQVRAPRTRARSSRRHMDLMVAVGLGITVDDRASCDSWRPRMPAQSRSRPGSRVVARACRRGRWCDGQQPSATDTAPKVLGRSRTGRLLSPGFWLAPIPDCLAAAASRLASGSPHWQVPTPAEGDIFRSPETPHHEYTRGPWARDPARPCTPRPPAQPRASARRGCSPHRQATPRAPRGVPHFRAPVVNRRRRSADSSRTIARNRVEARSASFARFWLDSVLTVECRDPGQPVL